MPVISRFYGIVITMYFNDHNPPHFHAAYAGCKALYGIDGAVLEGELPGRAAAFVVEWLKLHRNELESNWQKAQSGYPLDYISPLE